MATASKSAKAAVKPSTGSDQPLGIKCEVVGTTGPHWSGKTIFGLSLAPGVHPEGHQFAGQPRTLYLDFEKSGACYEGCGAERIDVPVALRDQFKDQAYKSIDMFQWFRKKTLGIKPGQFDVIVVDPVTDIEDGLVDYVRTHPTEFGYTSKQFSEAGGMMWGVVKALWKAVLADLAARCKIFYFVAHERTEWKGGRPTGKKIAKGKETLSELASLYLKLEREHPKDGEKPKPPSATILKDRLSHVTIDGEGEMVTVQILPERIPELTPKAIRHYVSHPVGLRKLKPEELIQDEKLSDDERKFLELEIATQNAAAATAQLTRAELMQRALEKQAAARGEPAPATTNGHEPGITDSQREAVGEILEGVCDSPDQAKTILRQLGVETLGALTRAQADEFITKLANHVRDIQANVPDSEASGSEASNQDQDDTEGGSSKDAGVPAEASGHEPAPAAPESASGPPADAVVSPGHEATKEWAQRHADETSAKQVENNGYCTSEQSKRINDLFTRLSVSPKDRTAIIERRGVKSLRSFTVAQADELIHKLTEMEIGLEPGK
jgi:hypothetical protein